MPNNAKRILLLSTSYLPLIGGSELAIKEVTDRLADLEFDLITARFSKDLPGEERIGRVRVFRVGHALNLFNFLLPKNFLPLAIFFKARKLLKSGQHYDAVHVWQASQAGGAGWVLKWFYPRLPLLLTLQEGQDFKKQSGLTRLSRQLIIKKADRATAISRYLKNYLQSVKKNLPVAIIPNGVDLNNFSREFSYGEISHLSDLLGIIPGDKVIISVSRLTFKNGLDDLIRSLGILVKQNPNIRYRLLLVGDGEQKAGLQKLAKELNLENQVIFAGTVGHADLPKYLKLADVFVRPSHSEGLGSAFLEAMAAGLPVMGAAVGGIPDFLTDTETGLFCDPLDPQDIAKKITIVLEDEDLRRKIIRNARELVREKYDWEQIAEEYQKFYEMGR